MFERFTGRARSVLARTQHEAMAMDHNFIGTEHILLALILERDGLAGRVLANAQVSYEAARAEVVTMIGLGRAAAEGRDAEALATIGIDLDAVTAAVEDAFGEGALDRRRLTVARRGKAPPFVPRAKRVLELSLREAKSLGHSYIGTEHLLLAILELHEGVAFEVLDLLHPPAEDLRAAVIDELQRWRPGA